MSSSITGLLMLSQFQVSENPGSAPSGVALTSLFSELDQLKQLGPTTTPAASLFGIYKQDVSTGYTIDATSMQGTSGTLNASGKKLVAMCISNPSASAGDVNVATGASNGYVLAQPVKVKPGGFAIIYQAAGLAAVDGTHKTIDVSGTNGDTPEIGLIFG